MSIERKRLIRALIPPAAVALLRFGGGGVLAPVGMGWRWGPRVALGFFSMGPVWVSAGRLSRPFCVSLLHL